MTPLTIDDLYNSLREDLSLTWVAGQQGGERSAFSLTAQGADLVGYLNFIHGDRVQVIGQREMAYLDARDGSRRDQIHSDLVASMPPAMVVAESLTPPADLLEAAERANVALFTSPLGGSEVIEQVRTFLQKGAAPSTAVHGVMVDVLGMGVLISGESGLGKSELALELISRGHGLVADDIVELTRIAAHTLEGRSPILLQNMLEVRGLGLLDIKTIFGETAARRKMRLKLIFHLVRRSTMENEYERLPLEALTEDILGVKIRKVVVPVAAGRNLAVLAEAAVRNTILQLRGIDSTQIFLERQQQMIEDSSSDPSN
jgi:HPr kinase/phosphorylase